MKSSIDRGSNIMGAVLANGQHRTAKWTAQPADGSTALPARNSALTDQESLELEQSEKIIKDGWKTFLEVGQALMKIQKKKLYRDGYATFELYCRDRLEISRPYAYNLIGSAEVLEDLSSIEDIPSKPANEAQTRYLIGLPKEKRIAAWKKAVETAGGHPVTAKLVREAVVKYKQKKEVKFGLKEPAKKSTVDKSSLIKILRMIEDAQEAVKAKDFSKAQKALQRMRETFSAYVLTPANASNPIWALMAD
jgi:hypothetical protein